MSYSCSTRVRNRDWLVDIAAELPSSWHHCKFAEAVEISYIFLPLSSLERTFVVTRSRVQVYSMWTFAGALQSLSGNGKTLNQWRPNKNTQTPSQALSYCRRCAHGMLVSKGALCCFLPSFCFDTSNTSMKLVYNTDRPWDSLSDFAKNIFTAFLFLVRSDAVKVAGKSWLRICGSYWKVWNSRERERERE